MQTNTRGINLQFSHHLSVEKQVARFLNIYNLCLFLSQALLFFSKIAIHDELEKQDMNINDEQRQKKKYHH